MIYRNGEIEQSHFRNLSEQLPEGSMLVFNNTKVIRARVIMHKPSGARIEVFCLEPHLPADYEHAFSVKGECEWSCIVGNVKKWKEGHVEINFDYNNSPAQLRAWIAQRGEREGARLRLLCLLEPQTLWPQWRGRALWPQGTLGGYAPIPGRWRYGAQGDLREDHLCRPASQI